MATMPMPNRINMISWNIWRGGFDSYDPTQAVPDREVAICNFIKHQHTALGVDTVFLSDAYLWAKRYGSNDEIARHLGYRNAIFMPLNDSRIEAIVGPGAGSVFATDHSVKEVRILDLGNRQGLGIILDVGLHGLQIANVYLDDLSEETRIKQTEALLAGLEKDMPTIITGDLNTLRPSMRSARFDVQVKDFCVRILTHLSPKHSAFNRRQVIPIIEDSGFIDADRRLKRPTAPAKFPAVGLDYVFHSKDLEIECLQVMPIHGESDHLPLSFSFMLK